MKLESIKNTFLQKNYARIVSQTILQYVTATVGILHLEGNTKVTRMLYILEKIRATGIFSNC